ncbi:MAG: mechanosensitive ion channel domain-containing protein [Actinomycetota bacterium]
MLGLTPDWGWRLIVAGAVLVVAGAVSRILTWRLHALAQRRAEDPVLLRRLQTRETMALLAETLIRYGACAFLLFWLLGLFVADTAAAVGGASLVVVIVGFGMQRVLMDAIAGFSILFEGWYVVGDFVTLKPMDVTGFVEEVGLRTTAVRSLNGDRSYIPNSQINAAVRSTRGYRTYTIEVLTTNCASVRTAIESAAVRAPTGGARFLRAPKLIEQKELSEGIWLVRATATVPPSLEWLAEGLLDALIRGQIPEDELVAGPIVYTLDESSVERYQRRVLVR